MAKKQKASDTKPQTSNVSKLIEEIGTLSVLELADLVKALEEKFGVPSLSYIPTEQAPPTAGQTSSGGAPTPEEQPAGQTTFNVVLISAGANKISVIKAVRELNQTLGLKEAKDLVESVPKEILTGVNKETAGEAKKKLEAVGASVELK